ncbi:hypothetical protein [Nonomuraea endophytica]|uniref:Uncharacterized protein n=1 Tax=Nonomuraea endophytica TaxID=714136 RepID=A0A7W8A8B4_9ACTN|nr:hypothetical protein [Nonomuraea endophytica]MBB5081472.1 hypothetical protein [Nonomuraea endophytica]
MSRPKYRLTCCLCGKFIPLASDVYPLNAEWQRRFPRMKGTLACGCAVNTSWQCRGQGDRFMPGHIPARDYDGTPRPTSRDHDAWSHIGTPATHVAAVLISPWSGMLQGAQEYLRHVAQARSADPEVASDLRTVIEEWDIRQTWPTAAR